MKLYYSKGACSFAVRIVLHELRFDCDYVSVDLKTKKTESGEDFLKINPKGTVPVLITNKNKILTENSVIQQYLVDISKNDLLLPKIGDFQRYRVLEWLNYISTDLHKGVGILFNAQLPEEVKSNIFIPAIKNKMTFVNQQLSAKKYLMGDTFTLPDGYLFVILTWLAHFKIDIKEWKHLNRYFDELKMRASVERALNEEGIEIA